MEIETSTRKRVAERVGDSDWAGAEKPVLGQGELRKKVLDQGICVHCGACVSLCPYLASYEDHLVVLDPCDLSEGRCYAFCPRTPTDLQTLREKLFDPSDWTPELGSLKGFYMTRASDEKVRNAAQHGGTVTALLSLALEEGMIDTAVVAKERQALLPEGVAVQNSLGLKEGAKSKFIVSPTLATFNRLAKAGSDRIGVVATPCQALSLAKMRLRPFPTKDNSIDKLRLVMGLFCGWALSWRGLRSLLREKTEEKSILGLDIPPSKNHAMEVHTSEGTLEISLDEVLPLVREACKYCFDMTAEFSDISVGSARLPEGWEAARGWNQVIVRTQIGDELLMLARSRGILEFRDMPKGNLDNLKKASMNKKRNAVKNLVEKSGSHEDLLYLDAHDPVLRAFISHIAP